MRPIGKPCARCVRNLLPGCEHLENTYDRYFLKRRGLLPAEVNANATSYIEQELIEYALNRMLALDRDNGNKAQGVQASRTYQSRNIRSARLIANLCGSSGPRGLRCIRSPHPDEPERHKF
jgi:hypothetical protein